MNEKYEVRIGYYGGLVVTSEMIKAQRFQLQMEQYYREKQEEHELLIYALKLKSESMRMWNWFSWFLR
jgi:hypothetical protein